MFNFPKPDLVYVDLNEPLVEDSITSEKYRVFNFGQDQFNANDFFKDAFNKFDLKNVAITVHARTNSSFHVEITYSMNWRDLTRDYDIRLNMELKHDQIYFYSMEYEDFSSFAKLHTQVKTNICHLSFAGWEDCGDEWVFTIRSNRFLRNMVRSVTGTLLDMGRGKLSADGLRRIIEKKDRCAAGVSMPPQGLFLTKVEYPMEELKTEN